MQRLIKIQQTDFGRVDYAIVSQSVIPDFDLIEFMSDGLLWKAGELALRNSKYVFPLSEQRIAIDGVEDLTEWVNSLLQEL